MLSRAANAAIVLAAVSSFALAQDGTYGVTVPVTASFGVMDTHRLQQSDPSRRAATYGFRVTASPTLRFGRHWFVYASLQERLTPYFYYDAYYPDHDFDFDLLQAFLGYSLRSGKTALVFKAGELSTAFGAFPLRYDDMQNPLNDQPLAYNTQLPLTARQLPCGTRDVLHQSYGYVWNFCGGPSGWVDGSVPATQYALPGVQIELSSGRFDARAQLADGSPANPLGWVSPRSYAQWAAGGGYTIRQGFRAGMSGFRGPYLSPGLRGALPSGSSPRSFPAGGLGFDGQWARGRFSLNAEWQRFWFAEPGFQVSPSLTAGYGELKAVLTPRVYLACRAGWLSPGEIVDHAGIRADHFAPGLRNLETGAGIWLNRRQLVKISYSWLHMQGDAGHDYDVLGLQLVTSFTPLNRAFR